MVETEFYKKFIRLTYKCLIYLNLQGKRKNQTTGKKKNKRRHTSGGKLGFLNCLTKALCAAEARSRSLVVCHSATKLNVTGRCLNASVTVTFHTHQVTGVEGPHDYRKTCDKERPRISGNNNPVLEHLGSGPVSG